MLVNVGQSKREILVGENKTKHFDMRLTPSESNALEHLAKRAGVSRSNYLRSFIRRAANKKRIPV